MYFITFSEMLGTNGEKIAKQAASTLSYGFLGEEELQKAAREMGFLTDVKSLDEKGPPLFERFFTERPKIHLDRLQSVIYEVAKKGNTVFFGRGSQLMLNSFGCAFHVLVTGSSEKRIQRVMAEHGLSREVAEKIVERSDHDKRGFIRFAFDEEWLNHKLYDLVLNTDKLSVDSAVRMVADSAKSEEIKACGVDSVKELGKLSLHRKVESALLEAGNLSASLFVTVEDTDSVRLFGIAGSSEEKGLAERTVKNVSGVSRVFNDVKIMRTGMMDA
jgi:cytidylate kinase